VSNPVVQTILVGLVGVLEQVYQRPTAIPLAGGMSTYTGKTHLFGLVRSRTQ